MDHRAVHDATVIAARRVPQLFCYQSPSSRNGFAPTRFVPVDDFVDGKVALLERYRSRSTRHYLEPDLVVAIARSWARQCPMRGTPSRSRSSEPASHGACDCSPAGRSRFGSPATTSR